MRAVFREYPLQLLSFRGTYLVLDYIDTLSSERQDDYKYLLSDVKCRTVNKQYAQWLLSIRSFALISLCWSVIKFYRKTAQDEGLLVISGKTKDSIPNEEKDLKDPDKEELNNEFKTKSNLSSSSSSSSNSNSSSCRVKSAKSSSKFSIQSSERLESSYSIIPKKIKYEFYLEAVLK